MIATRDGLAIAAAVVVVDECRIAHGQPFLGNSITFALTRGVVGVGGNDDASIRSAAVGNGGRFSSSSNKRLHFSEGDLYLHTQGAKARWMSNFIYYPSNCKSITESKTYAIDISGNPWLPVWWNDARR